MYEYQAYVSNVVDGDTVDCVIDLGFHMTATLRLRLYGIDTPEIVGSTREAGLRAKSYTTERLLGHNVVIKTYKSDSFGRWLADITIDDTNFNQELITKGFAVPYFPR